MYNESVAAVLNILATSSSCGKNIHFSYQHYQPGKVTLQISVLMIEYLVVRHRIMDDVKRAIFVALMTVAVEIVIEKSRICAWKKVLSHKKWVRDSELRNFIIKGFYRQN